MNVLTVGSGIRASSSGVVVPSEIYSWYIAIVAAGIFSCIIAIVADTFLMIGAAKEKRSFLLPWLFVEVNS